jgi:hypothetical protein
MARLLRIALSTLLVTGVAAGCGGDEVVTVAETEGIYLDINGLKYQIEMSRYMNPEDVEDSQYFVGLPENSAPPTEDEIYFGVWVWIQNVSKTETRPAASFWEIHDTQDNIYRPIPLDTDINPWVFEAVDVPPGTVLPLPSSAAGQGPIQGMLLLFKIRNESFQNRPLELRFSNGGDSQEGVYDLDV